MRFTLELRTQGENQIVNLVPKLAEHSEHLAGEGVLHLFVVGSTAALTTLEFEPGLVKTDVRVALQRLAPDDAHYDHEATWNDDNGHSHIRAALLGPSLSIPFSAGKLLTGEWQQPVLLELDTRARKRTIICTVLRGG